MTKFMVLYESSVSAGAMMANATPEQMQAGMDAWAEWAGNCGDAIIDLGSPLAATKRIAAGAASKSDSQASGFSVLQAASLDAVTRLLEGHPHLRMPGASIQVLEFLSMPGM